MMPNPVQHYVLYGLVSSPVFQKCTEAAELVNSKYSDMYSVMITLEVPRDYESRREAWVKSGLMQGKEALLESPAVVEAQEGGSLLSGQEFLEKMSTTTSFRLEGEEEAYAIRAQQSWRRFLRDRQNQYCWMSVEIDGVPAGTIHVELYSKAAPLTCNNFAEFCRGTELDGVEGEVGYKGTTFFRILKDAWVMAGDVTPGHTGNSGTSCYGTQFPDEAYTVQHDAAGVVGMCNDGPHTNASSFYITRKAMPWMDRKYIAFGRVMDGMSVVDAIHSVEVKHSQAPRSQVVISDCGVMDVSV